MCDFLNLEDETDSLPGNVGEELKSTLRKSQNGADLMHSLL